MLATEHILLESDLREVPEFRRARITHARLVIRSRVRRRTVELVLFDFCYVSVRTWRSRNAFSRPDSTMASSPPDSKYVIDLRFVDPRPRLSRHIAWRWMTASAALALLAVAVAWWIGSSSTRWWQHDWLPALGALLGLTACATLVSLYRTTETLTLFSVCGRARLLELTGGLRTFQPIRRFSHQLAAHLRIAAARRRTSLADHLRDEMREHFRLKEAGVVSEGEYEVSKIRILRKHAAA